MRSRAFTPGAGHYIPRSKAGPTTTYICPTGKCGPDVSVLLTAEEYEEDKGPRFHKCHCRKKLVSEKDCVTFMCSLRDRDKKAGCRVTKLALPKATPTCACHCPMVVVKKGKKRK